MLAREAGKLVFFRIKQLPVILGQAVKFFQGLADVHKVKAFMACMAVNPRMVELHECAAHRVIVHVNARVYKAFLVRGGQAGEVFYGGGTFVAVEAVPGEIDCAHLRGASAILPNMSPARQRRHS